MNYTAPSTSSTNTNTCMQGDEFIDDFDIMDDTGLFNGEDQQFTFDTSIFESSETYHGLPLDNGRRRLSLTLARRLSITSVFNEDQEYQVESLSPDRYLYHTFSLDQEDCVPTMVPSSARFGATKQTEHSNRPARKSRQGRMKKGSRPAILSLLTSDQLEQHLEETKARLAETMERSAMSRKRLNHEVDSSPEEQYSTYKAQRSILSQSRAQFASYMNSGMNISSRTL